jgi:steroid 5-alpha reductase family enzyme
MQIKFRPMDGTREIFLRFPRVQAQNTDDDLVIDPSMFALSVFVLAALAVYFVALQAIARSGGSTLTSKALWSLAVVALPILGGLLWLRFVPRSDTKPE